MMVFVEKIIWLKWVVFQKILLTTSNRVSATVVATSVQPTIRRVLIIERYAWCKRKSECGSRVGGKSRQFSLTTQTDTAQDSVKWDREWARQNGREWNHRHTKHQHNNNSSSSNTNTTLTSLISFYSPGFMRRHIAIQFPSSSVVGVCKCLFC